MAIPKTKSELIEFSNTSFEKLNDFVDALSEKERNEEFPPGTLNRNIRDVMAHLYHWQLLMEEWYQIGMKDGKPEMPAKGYSWKTVPELNTMIQKKYSGIELSEIRKMLNKTHAQMHQIMDKYTDKELFEKKRYSWTGSTSLAVYLRASTSSHYGWALKLIRKVRKSTEKIVSGSQ